jgi:hypothetical protein
MLFVAFWTLNRDIEPSRIAKVSAKMLEEEKFPLEGTEIIQWLVCPGGKGVTVFKAESEAQAFQSYTSWMEALPGMFTSYELLPALEAQDAIPLVME